MGQARRRGTFEERKAQAVGRQASSPRRSTMEFIDCNAADVPLPHMRRRSQTMTLTLAAAVLGLASCGHTQPATSWREKLRWLGPIGFSVEVGPVKAGITLLGTAGRSTPEIPDLPDLPDINEPEPPLPTQ